MGRRKWNVLKLNKELSAEISAELGLDPIAALLLTQKDFGSKDELLQFISDSNDLIDPFSLPDMEAAVARINDAIFDGELICVFGDYDCDGVTSTTLLYSYLEAQGANVTYLLPNRIENGYGLSKAVIDKMAGLGTDLIITVDNGISAVEEADYIKSLGMELIVTDHHIEGDVLPDCVAVVDPHRRDVECPFRHFAGVGVALMLCCAIEGNTERVLDAFSDLAAIGTVADLVPLIGDNRKIVKYGLESINASPRPGVQELINVARLSGKHIVSSNIGFGLGPRINAAGRMDTAERAVELLLSDEPQTCSDLAAELEELNQKRHQEEDKILHDAMLTLEENPEISHCPVIVVSGKGWHEGVLGIVASKIVEKTLRPVIVLAELENGMSKGSARSVEGFSIFEAVSSAKEYLILFGGHDLAAGMSLKTENISAFRQKINEYAYSAGIVYPSTKIDIKLLPESVTLETLDAVSVLEPFGNSNESPVFGLYKLTVDDVRSLGDEGKHKRLTLHREGRSGTVSAVKFNSPFFPYVKGDVVDLIVVLDRNEYKGRVSVNVIIRDIRPSGTDDDEMARSEILYDKFLSGQSLTHEEKEKLYPVRAVFSSLYKFLKHCSGKSIYDYEYLHSKAVQISGLEIPLCQTRVAITAMRQLGLISVEPSGEIKVPEAKSKVELDSAEIIKQLGVKQ